MWDLKLLTAIYCKILCFSLKFLSFSDSYKTFHARAYFSIQQKNNPSLCSHPTLSSALLGPDVQYHNRAKIKLHSCFVGLKAHLENIHSIS